MELCVCQWVCPDISAKGSACVEVGAQSKAGQVAKEMCLWDLKSGSPVFHSQLYYLLEMCPCPGAFPQLHYLCLCPHACPSSPRSRFLCSIQGSAVSLPKKNHSS